MGNYVNFRLGNYGNVHSDASTQREAQLSYGPREVRNVSLMSGEVPDIVNTGPMRIRVGCSLKGRQRAGEVGGTRDV